MMENTRTRKQPASQRAVEFLSRIIDDARVAGQPRLPALSAMARSAGVSRMTMWHAISQMKSQGTLQARQGRWVELAAQSNATPAITNARAATVTGRWREIRIAIEQDILAGALRFGLRLPSLKDLSTKYRVSTRTIRRALVALTRDGAVVAHGRGFAVASLKPRRSASTVALIARGEPPGELIFTTPWSMNCFRVLENECAHTDVELEIHPLYFIDTNLRWNDTLNKRLADPDTDSPLLGFMFFPTAIQRPVAEKLARAMGKTGKPVSILDEDHYQGASRTLPQIVREHPRSVLFSIANNTDSGRQVGRHLLELGHRRVAYVSLHHDSSHSRRRLTGLVDAFADAGFENAVVSVTAGNVDPPSGNDTTMRIAEALRPHLPLDLHSLYDGHFVNDRTMRNPLRQVSNLVYLGNLRTLLFPMFDRILAERHITAWVGENDTVALSMLDYLTSHSKRVPEDVSVIGFDDSDDAFIQHVSSYDFNAEFAVRAMLNYVIAPDTFTTRERGGAPVQIPGYVKNRRTTGPA